MAEASEGERIALERIAREADERTGFLDLGMLSLTELPAALFGLKHLHGLNLGWRWRDASGKWQEAPGELRRNQVASSLGRLAALPDLRDLWLEGLDLDTLSSLSGLENLQSIDCSSTQVNDLAPLAGLQALESVNCSWTQVRDLAPLAGLQALQSVDCSGRQVSDLAPLAGLPALQSVDCSGTQVSDLAPLAGLQALQSIDCDETQVSDLAPLAQIASLRSITANGLKLAESSTACLALPALQELRCYQTRLRGVPAEVLSRGYGDNCLPRLRAHFRDLADGGVESRDVKLMVLGNGRVGKTQLCRRLQGLPYDGTLPSTHGIVVESFDLPRGARPDFAEVHIWDFGGQDIYHGTHTLFLRANAVFVLLWAPEFESGEQTHGGLTFRNYPLRYWVDYVRQLDGKDAAVLIVQTRCDSHRDHRACPVKDDDLREAFGSGYCEVLQFSALNDRGLPGLKEKLGEAIEFLREAQGVARIGASRQRVKARLEKLREKDAKLSPERRRHRWLTQDEFGRICAKERLVSEPKFLLDYLHNTGVVFTREGLFEDRIVLDQSWALAAIYAVFNRDSCLRQLRHLRGRFTGPLLEALVWAGRPAGEQKLLIGIMESCGICFEIREGDEKAWIEAEYVAPDLLPERRDIQTELDGLWAWNDPADPQREKDVDRTCAAAEARGAPIIRDKTAMTVGDSIS
ncbi:COR domain-containing protein, partial [Roseiarcus sp.]|uniref:COR domain-containing protein n=1 Tax=Roseiarcus sp. TaxID=1969460 RepID=UPI003F9D7F8C